MKTRSGNLRRAARYGLLSLCFSLSWASCAYASTASVSPTIPVEGQPVTVTYDPAGGPLDAAGTVYIHKGENGWNNVVDLPMTLSNGLWYVTYTVPTNTFQINFVFNSAGSAPWDNNNDRDWGYRTRITGADVMMQGFYWDCFDEGSWYSIMTTRAPGLRSMHGGYGIDRIWFPAPSKGDNGGNSMGYDPYDYYDVGQYNQKGSTPTAFGTQADLKNTIAAYKDLGVLTMADIILNHRAGGNLESNPNTGGLTRTDFRFVASGECTWRYTEFHPSDIYPSDPGDLFYEDVCHLPVGVPGAAHYDLIEWGNWLRDPANAGFDGGWRFDYPKGIWDWVVKDFRQGTGDDFGVLEYYDGNVFAVRDYVRGSSTPAFDFPAFFTMKDVFNNNHDIRKLINPDLVFAAREPVNAVTFVANHDTDHEANYIDDKMLAYAFILTYQGYPCIFWKDYYNYGLNDLGGQDGNGIDPLVWVRGALRGGEQYIQLLKTDDDDFLIYGTQDGSVDAPGYIMVLNNHDTSTQSAAVTTANTFLHGKELECQAWYSYVSGQNVKPANTTCSAGGTVTVQAPPRGYAVYSITTSLPSGTPWEYELNVGDAADLPGSTDYYNDTFKITGAGSGVGGTADGCYFLFDTASGDCGIQARVLDLTDPGSMPQAGVMMRYFALQPGYANAAMFVTPDDGVIFQWRDVNFGGTSSTNIPGISMPCWVKLERAGNAFSGFYSTDGSNWTQVGTSQTIAMPATIITGPAVTAGDSNKMATATMDQISVNLAPGLPEIDDEVLIAGNTLIFTNEATDADSPAQTLTYSLDNPPAGASIGSANGIFEWRPQIDQSPSTQTVVVVVSDDGVPDLSASQDFTVTVLQPASPSMSDMVLTNGQFGFSVGGDTGPDYTIMWTTNLVTGEWLPLYTTNSPALPFFWSTPVSGVATSEFFAVELGP